MPPRDQDISRPIVVPNRVSYTCATFMRTMGVDSEAEVFGEWMNCFKGSAVFAVYIRSLSDVNLV